MCVMRTVTIIIMVQRTTRGLGEDHVGSFRAQYSENDAKSAALDMRLIRFFAMPFGWRQHRQTNDLTLAQFSFVTWPLAETSTE